MNKVFAVVFGAGYELDAIFSNREKAEQFANEQNRLYGIRFDHRVIEVEVR